MESVDLEVLGTVQRWIAGGERAWLVTVADTFGSSPRPPGSLLGVNADGRLVGSVSGGCVEDDLVRRLQAGEVAGGLPQLVRYGVTREQTQRFGLPCGGSLGLVVERLGMASGIDGVLDALKARQLVGRELLLGSGEVRLAAVDPDAHHYFDGQVLRTVHGPRWRLLLIGAVQVSRYLAQMAQALDYQVMVCDPRDTHQWSLEGVDRLPGMPDDVVLEIVPDARTAIVALTHDPKLDDMALLEALKSAAFYVGALGSQANSDRRRERLALFDLTPVQIARLHGPVGLPIGSRTPPEIAVSILAEMTAVRHRALHDERLLRAGHRQAVSMLPGATG